MKNIEGTELYSMKDMLKKYMNDTTVDTRTKFISFLVRNHFITKKVIKYPSKNISVYSMDSYFGDILHGHWYTESKKYKDEVLNGTLYFDEFGAKFLTRCYRMHIARPEKLVDINRILLDVSLDYVPKIGQHSLESSLKKLGNSIHHTSTTMTQIMEKKRAEYKTIQEKHKDVK